MRNVTIYMEVFQTGFMEKMAFKQKPEGDAGASVFDTGQRLSKGSGWEYTHHVPSKEARVEGVVSKAVGRVRSEMQRRGPGPTVPCRSWEGLWLLL